MKLIAFIILTLLVACDNSDDNYIYRFSENGTLKGKYDKKKQILYWYYPTGEINSISAFKNGRYNGPSATFYKNRQLKWFSNFNNNNPTVVYYYNEKGVLVNKIEYVYTSEFGNQLNEKIYFDESGDTIKNKGFSFRVLSKNDTIKFNEKFCFSIVIDESINKDSILISISDLDSVYRIKDPVPIMEKQVKYNEQIFICISPKYTGENYVRGVIYDFTHLGDSLRFNIQLFSKKYYVKQ